MPDLTPSILRALCEALNAGNLATKAPGVDWVQLDPQTGEVHITAGRSQRAWNLARVGLDLAAIWRFSAPAWAQPALDGLPVTMTDLTQPEAPDEAQGDLWSTR